MSDLTVPGGKEAGVDWVTLTRSDHAKYKECRQILMPHLLEEKNAGREPRAGGLRGYYGVRTDHCFIGRRDDGMMCQVTGALADLYYMPLWRLSEHCARLDIQVTERLEEWTIPEELERVYQEAVGSKRVGRRVKPTYQGGVDGKQTVYIGSPASDQRGRAYNKEKESKQEHFKQCVRFEVQLRNECAMAAIQHIEKSRKPTSALSRLVEEWYRARGVTIAMGGGNDEGVPFIGKKPTTLERQLAWVESQVSPVIKRCLEEAGVHRTVSALCAALDKEPAYKAIIMKAAQTWAGE